MGVYKSIFQVGPDLNKVKSVERTDNNKNGTENCSRKLGSSSSSSTSTLTISFDDKLDFLCMLCVTLCKS